MEFGKVFFIKFSNVRIKLIDILRKILQNMSKVVLQLLFTAWSLRSIRQLLLWKNWKSCAMGLNSRRNYNRQPIVIVLSMILGWWNLTLFLENDGLSGYFFLFWIKVSLIWIELSCLVNNTVILTSYRILIVGYLLLNNFFVLTVACIMTFS